MRIILCLVALVVTLAACSTKPVRFDDEASIRAVSYRDPGPASLTLITVIRTQTGGGGHAALMINASERVIFDPAGSFYLDDVPERHDVLYGITPQKEFIYRSSHARLTWHVKSQRIEVPSATAQLAFELVKQAGPVQDGLCSSAIVDVLRKLPGFESINSTLFPAKLSMEFGQIPGVTETLYYEDDDVNLQMALEAANDELTQK